MTTVELYNLALYKIGVSKPITALTDQSREAITGSAVYDHMLRATLRHFPWSFATKYAEPLTLVGGPVPSDLSLVQSWSATPTYQITDAVDLAGTRYYAIAANQNHTPPNATYWDTVAPTYVNKDWAYSYRWPTDCLYARRMPREGSGRLFDPSPITFRIGRDVNGLLIYSNEPDAHLEYTCLDCDALWADDLWIDAFTWRIAAYLAPSLSQLPNMAQTAYAMYLQTLRVASAVSSNESQLEKDGDAGWILDRS